MPRLRSDEVIKTSLKLVKTMSPVTYHRVAVLVGYSPEHYRKSFLPLLLEEAGGCIVKGKEGKLIWVCRDYEEVEESSNANVEDKRKRRMAKSRPKGLRPGRKPKVEGKMRYSPKRPKSTIPGKHRIENREEAGGNA